MMLKNCLLGQWAILLLLSLIWFAELCWWGDSMVISECRFLWAMWIHGRFGHKVHQVSRSFDKFDMLHIGYVLAMFAPCHLGSWDIIMVLKPFLALNPLYLDASMKNDPSKIRWGASHFWDKWLYEMSFLLFFSSCGINWLWGSHLNILIIRLFTQSGMNSSLGSVRSVSLC